MHVSVALHFCIEIKIFDVQTHEFGVWRGYDAVEDNFGRRDAGCWCADIVRIIDQVASNGETVAMRFFFLGTDCAEHTTVRHLSLIAV